jgi:DNA helicase-2/ATP-dependent DNA helicase PcrA
MKLEQHTPVQQQAILTKDKTVLVVAGPGSGKTATTVARIKHLIEDGVDPSKIVAITFTNAAAREMHNRLILTGEVDLECAGARPIDLGHCGTLHSFALKMLKQFGGSYGYGARMSLVSPESAQDLLLSKAQTLGCKLKVEDLLKLKSQGRPAKGTRMDLGQTVVASYYQDLREAGIVDFDILLTEFARLLTEDSSFLKHDYEYLFVDEVQDSGPVDWEIYLELPIPNKFYVGDPDQAIYGFRGGDLNGMMWLAKKTDTTVIKLEENFRSHSEICNCAQNLIENNTDRIDKQTLSVKGTGGQVQIAQTAMNEGSEIALVAARIQTCGAFAPGSIIDMAVLCRTNAIAFEIQKQLEAAGLPVIKRERSTLPKDWPLLRSLVELMVNPDNDTLAYFYLTAFYQSIGLTPKEARAKAHAERQAAHRAGKTINQMVLRFDSNALNKATENISNESRMLLGQIIRSADLANPLELALAVASYRDSIHEDRKAKLEGIYVMTIHASKGREFDAVFLVGWEDEIIPGRNRSPREVEEDRRLAYVGITRARNFVMITNAATRQTPWGSIEQHTPSRFITEIGSPSSQQSQA